MFKKYIACDICGKSFESYDSDCQKCEFYHRGLNRYGETQSNLDHQIGAGLENLTYMAKQVRSDDNYD